MTVETRPRTARRYRDWATIDVEAFAADPETLAVPRAGEVRFRLR